MTCPGVAINLTVSGAATYSWSSGASTGTLTVSPTVSTVYTVTGFGANGCSHTITKTVSTTGGPALTVDATPSLICAGEPATLSVSGASTYAWSGGGTGNTRVVFPHQTSVYTVTGSIGATCKGSVQVTVEVLICPGIRGYRLSDEVELFPNPASREVNVVCHATPAQGIVVMDALGKIVGEYGITEGKARINVSAYTKGVYNVRLVLKDRQVIRKLVVE
jgi:hypothetical protein